MLSFLPKYIFPKITDIQPAFLKQKGIKLVLLDFDNTMLPYTVDVPSEELLNWMKSMKEAKIQLCIVSNSHKQRVPTFSKKYDIPCVTGAKKPGTNGIKEAISNFGADHVHTALIGDQIYTDVLGANRANIVSIIVKSIHNHNFWLKLRHVFEVPFLVLARKRRVKV